MHYTDPGLELARLVRHELKNFIAENGEAPKVIYLKNHGMFALGSSAEEVVQVTQMAVKCARILGGALSVGHPVYLSPTESARIDTRPDELLRRKALAEPADQTTYFGHAHLNERSAR
jgi:ribulose-5-phosphate 4-epimerase/fuculose-1-phosphate aldolase